MNQAEIFSISNSTNHTLKFTRYGASLLSWDVPLINDSYINIVLGMPDVNDYKSNQHCIGSVVGRFANRISNACFRIDGIKYNIEENEGRNNLHSGISNYTNRKWHVKLHEKNRLIFSIESSHLDGGFPGSLAVEVEYMISDDNELHINYLAKTDKPTIINLTNHSYFNLDGVESKSIMNHRLQVLANHYLPTDKDSIPTGVIQAVDNSIMDLRIEKKLNEIKFEEHREFEHTIAFDHNYVLTNTNTMKLAAVLVSEKTGLSLECYTDQLGVQIYTGNFLNHSLSDSGKKFYKHQGICIETQNFPDSPNNQHFPSSLIKNVYKHKTIYSLKKSK